MIYKISDISSNILVFLFHLNGENYNRIKEIEYIAKIDDEITNPHEIDEKYVLSVTTLMDECNKALDAIYLCSTKKFKKHGLMTQQSDWADLRLWGPYVTLNDDIFSCNKVEVYGHLPHFCVTGYATKNKLRDDHQDYVFTVLRRQMQAPTGVIPTGNGYIYSFEAIYMYKDCSYALQNYISIDNAGNITFCKLLQQDSSVIKKSGRMGKIHYSVPTKKYHIMDKYIANDGVTCVERDFKPLVAFAFNTYANQSLNVCIRASDNRGRVNFSMPVKMAKYIFNKRIKVKTPSGKTKPIFHWVISHKRKNGSAVRTHTRGLREFYWNGMKIKIYIPGTHETAMHEMENVIDNRENSAWDKLLAKAKGIETKVQLINPSSHEEVNNIYTVKEGSDITGKYYHL